MAEKPPVHPRKDLVKIEVYEQKDWLHIDASVKADELGDLIEDLLGSVIPGLPGAGKTKGKFKITAEDLIAFGTQLPLVQLEDLVNVLSSIVVKRKQKEK